MEEEEEEKKKEKMLELDTLFTKNRVCGMCTYYSVLALGFKKNEMNDVWCNCDVISV